MTLYSSSNHAYELGKKLGEGGEGAVFRIKGDPNRVIKLYKQPKKNQIDKISKMVKSELRKKLDVAFPEDVVYENGEFRGYVMKEAKGSPFSSSYSNSSNNTVSQKTRVELAINLCIALINVHEAGYIFGDFNPANIRCDLNDSTITLIDTDSFIFDKYGGIVARPEVVPKEIRDAMKYNDGAKGNKKNLPFSVESDNYTLAVHVFRLLMNGEHPFIYKSTTALSKQPMYSYDFDKPVFPYVENELHIVPPPHAVPLESLPLDLQTLFVRMFREGYSDNTIRPTAEEFLDELKDYYKKIVGCGKDKTHAYYRDLKACPFCEADERFRRARRGDMPPNVKVSSINYVYTVEYEDVIKNPSKIKHLEEAVNRSKPDALTVMGRLYSDGIIKGQDDKKAFELYKRASIGERPSPEAQYRLALCYLDGIGVGTDKNEAIVWLNNSSKMGYGPAKQLLGYVHQLENLVDYRRPIPSAKSKIPKQQQKTNKSEIMAPVKTAKSKTVSLKEAYDHCKYGKWRWPEVTPHLLELKMQADLSAENEYMYAEILSIIDPDNMVALAYYRRSASKGYGPAKTKVSNLNDSNKSGLMVTKTRVRTDVTNNSLSPSKPSQYQRYYDEWSKMDRSSLTLPQINRLFECNKYLYQSLKGKALDGIDKETFKKVNDELTIIQTLSKPISVKIYLPKVPIQTDGNEPDPRIVITSNHTLERVSFGRTYTYEVNLYENGRFVRTPYDVSRDGKRYILYDRCESTGGYNYQTYALAYSGQEQTYDLRNCSRYKHRIELDVVYGEKSYSMGGWGVRPHDSANMKTNEVAVKSSKVKRTSHSQSANLSKGGANNRKLSHSSLGIMMSVLLIAVIISFIVMGVCSVDLDWYQTSHYVREYYGPGPYDYDFVKKTDTVRFKAGPYFMFVGCIIYVTAFFASMNNAQKGKNDTATIIAVGVGLGIWLIMSLVWSSLWPLFFGTLWIMILTCLLTMTVRTYYHR